MEGAGRSEAIGRTLTPAEGALWLIRPMLGMSRAEIEKYAQEHDVPYREDRTNKESIYKRNRIRNIIFPEFEKINPSFIRTLNTDIGHFRQVDDIAEDYFRDHLERIFDGSRIDVPALLSLKHWEYIIFRLLEPYGFSSQVLESVIRLLTDIAGGKEMTFSGKRFEGDGYVLLTSAGAMSILQDENVGKPSAMKVLVTGPGEYQFNGRTVLIEEYAYTPGMRLKQEKGILVCDADALPFPFTLRCWQSGDWMRPFGMNGKAKKVSDLFTDLKLSISEKERAVMAVTSEGGSHVAAVAGYRMDEALRVSEGSTHIIRISLI